MVFLLNRILPFVLPLLYFLSLKFLFVFSGYWHVFLILILVGDFIFFFFLNKKVKDRKVFLVFLHSIIFVLVGFAYVVILDSRLLINLFVVFWSVVYLIYLESIFHFFYRTDKVILIDFANIVAYVNLAAFFLMMVVLVNFKIFLNLAWWWLILVGFIGAFVFCFNRFLVLNIDKKINLLYSLIIAAILAELSWALLILPVSFFVSSLIMAVAYYLFSSLSALKFQEKLMRLTVLKYSVFALIVLILVLATAVWI
ncbi:MAG: hypothetical protein AAB358_03735 [Patescibacteria group bacterium]